VICYIRRLAFCTLFLVIIQSCNAAGGIKGTGSIVLLISGLIGGLGLFLMGIKMMGDSLTKTTGDSVRNLLSKLTTNNFKAFLTGIFTTIIFQSSSATTVMLVTFVNSRLIKFINTVAIIFGAAIGATITIQLIAFRLTDYALTIVAAGFLLYLLSKKQHLRGISITIIGFGILFLGMNIMSESMEPFKTSEKLVSILVTLENPVTGLLAGALLTALIQSSSAFIGILIVLSGQGLISLSAAVPLIIGANIGTAITAIIASAGCSRESKQVALAHTLFKVIGALIIVWFIPYFVEIVQQFTANGNDSISRQIANAHTLFNTIIAFLFLPFSKPYARLINKILPLKEDKHVALSTWYISDGLLHTPSLALSVARQEVLRMMEITQRMTEDILIPFMERRKDLLDKIREKEKEVNFLRDAINNYLVKIIRQDVTSAQVQETYQMMYAIDEFEQIGDILSVNLLNKAERWCDSKMNFSEEGQKEIRDFHAKTMSILYQAYTTFSEGNKPKAISGAKKSKASYNQFRTAFFELEKQHYNRLKMDVEESVESSRTHMEIIGSLKVIGSHATNIARIILKEHKNGAESPHRAELERSTEG
jgi:phosphate:Na+ symporter